MFYNCFHGMSHCFGEVLLICQNCFPVAGCCCYPHEDFLQSPGCSAFQFLCAQQKLLTYDQPPVRFWLHWETASINEGVCKTLSRKGKVQSTLLCFGDHYHKPLKLKWKKPNQPIKTPTNQIKQKVSLNWANFTGRNACGSLVKIQNDGTCRRK